MRVEVHVIPIPGGMRVEDAWAEIRVLGELAEGRTVSEDGFGGVWAVIEVESEEGAE